MAVLCLSKMVAAESPETLNAQDERVRDRYKQVLERSPFQDRAFDQVFDSYLNLEGIDTWVEELSAKLDDEAAASNAGILLGRIYARQLKPADAIDALQKAGRPDRDGSQYDRLLGTLYYRSGDNEKGIEFLTEALEELDDLDDRTQVSRMLGNLFLREGDSERAIEVWKQITAQTPNDLFAQLELAGVYEENRFWDQAIAVYRHIVDISERDPYRRCRALRSIGNCQLNAEKYPEAIASYESALELVSPGNWLFEDLKLRLVQVYEDMGDLAGLVDYINARLSQDPADTDFRDLLAETYRRMNRLEEAESEYQAILERDPRHAPTFEKLIELYQIMEQPEKVAANFEKLIELFPADTDYLRRLGEIHWRAGDIDTARQTWERLIKDEPRAETIAELAGWYQSYEFPEDAIKFYRQALPDTQNKDWSFQLAELLFEKGDNDEAMSTWTSVLEKDSVSGAEYAEVASILDAHQKPAEAEPLWSKAVEAAPETLDFHFQYARNLMIQEKHEEALKTYEHLASQTENVYFRDRGETGRLDAYSKLGVLEEKQQEWEDALKAEPENVELIGRLARLYERAGQRERALVLQEQRAELKPDNADFRRELIRSYRSAKLFDKAIAQLVRLSDQDKTRARVYQQELLEIYLGMDLRDEAIATAEKVVELAPADAEARLDLAQVYMLYQRPEDGLQQYRYALRLEPDESKYHQQYGSALRGQAKWGEAQAAFRKMLDTATEDDTRLSAVGFLASIHLQQGSIDDLISEFNRRVRNTPKSLRAYSELSRIHQETGDLVKRVSVLEDGLQNVDDKVPALQAVIRAAYESQDFAKVLTNYEQLVRMRAKPSPYEYERLGSIYAQMGDLEKARETWIKMVDDAGDDPKAYDRLVSVFQRENFINEAIEYKKRALDMDAFDFKRRWEYANLLASNERVTDALDQLNQILEIGEREDDEEASKSNQSIITRTRGRSSRNAINPNMFMYGIQRMGGRYYGGSLPSKLSEARSQVVGYMTSLAQNSIGEDALIEQFEETIKAQPKNSDAKRDIMTVYQMFGRVDKALETAQAILELSPDDGELIQQTALYFSSQQQHDEAIELMEGLVESHPDMKDQARQGLIALYMQKQEPEKALELANTIMEEDPDNYQSMVYTANILQQQGKMDEALAIYEKAQEKADKSIAVSLSMNIAQLLVQKGDKDKAREKYAEMLQADTSALMGVPSSSRNIALYTPDLAANNAMMARYGLPGMRILPPNVIGQVDYFKSTAIQQLQTLSDENENYLQPLIDQARTYDEARSRQDRDAAWGAAKMIIANYISTSEPEEADKWIEETTDAGKDRIEWYNLALYAAKERNDCDKMIELYEAVQARFPAQARHIVSAKAKVSILCEDYEQAAKHIRQMIQQRVPPQELLQVIRPLSGADQNQLAKDLLEEHLTGISRNGEALALLAELYGKEDEHEKAIELAREAWDRSRHASSGQNYQMMGIYMSGMSRPGRTTDGLLSNLYQYYVKAGRSEELLEEFKDRLEKQPGSVRLHENLAQLHILSKDQDAAIAVYETLISKRPHLAQVKQRMAQMYAEKGDFPAATKIYEELLKSNPNLYQQISWELRNLYQRSGQGKQMAKLENELARKATNPDQIRQLASQFRQSGDFKKAAEMYEKALKMMPGYTFMNRDLADVYIQMGQHDRAIQLYKDWLQSPTIRTQGGLQSYVMQHLAGVFASTGRLDELKAIQQSFIEKNENDPLAKSLEPQIALFEKRFDDAVNGYVEEVKSGQDMNMLNGLLEIAEMTGRVSEVLEKVKDAPMMANFYDKRRLARYYMSGGEIDKGIKLYKDYVTEQSQYGGSVWYHIREAVDMFGQYDRWDDAEELVSKNHKGVMQEYDRQEFNRIVSEAYVNNGRMVDFVEEILSKDSFKDSDAALITSIAQAYQRQNKEQKRLQFLERVVEKDASNRTLQVELINLLMPGQPEKALEKARQLVEVEGANDTYRRLLADALFATDASEEAIEMLQAWAEEKPAENRYQMLASYQQRLNRLWEARQSYEKAVELADASKKESARLALANFDAAQGDVVPVKQVHKEMFEANKNPNTFNQYLNYLRQNGYYQEAGQLLLDNREEGFLDRYRGSSTWSVLTDIGDFDTPVDIIWNFLRYSEQYNQDYYLQQATEYYRNRGKLDMLLGEIQRRLEDDDEPNAKMLSALAKAYADIGETEQADAMYEQVAALNPFDQNITLNRAGWLAKSGRKEEAIKLISNLPHAPTLREEVNNQISLINYYYQDKNIETAEKRIEDLISWNKAGNTLLMIADIYFAQQQYEKARKLYEDSLSQHMTDQYRMANSMANLGRCYAVAGESEKAIEYLKKAGASQNGSYAVRSAADWMIAKELFDTAIPYLEDQVSVESSQVAELQKLAECYFKAGRESEAIDLYERAWTVRSENERSRVTSNFSGFILKNDYLEKLNWNEPSELLKDVAPTLASNLIHHAKDEAGFDVLKPLESLITNKPGVLLAKGGAYRRFDQKEKAQEAYNKALELRQDENNMTAPMNLILLSPDHERAKAILRKHVDEHPTQLYTNSLLFDAYVSIMSDEDMERLLGTLDEMLPYEPHRLFYRYQMARARGNDALKKETLDQIIENPKLPLSKLQQMAKTCEEDGDISSAAVFLNQISSGGYYINSKWEALSELARLHTELGDIQQAAQPVSELYPQWHMRTGMDGVDKVYAKFKPGQVEGFGRGVQEVVDAHPDHERNVFLVGYYGELAEKVGYEGGAVSAIESLKLDPTLKERAMTFAGMIETWRIAGPYPSSPAQGSGIFGNLDNPFAPETDPDTVQWKTVLPEDSYGFIQLDKIFGLENQDSDYQIGYAETTLISPDEREITVSLGSDDWILLWLNGEQVHRFAGPRSGFADQEKVHMTLKPGENRLLAKIGNLTNSWRFCLRISENGDGVTVKKLER
jgi:tetratricopeptide (TPR) repeat protein